MTAALVTGLLLSTGIALVGRRLSAFTPDGAAAAASVGTAVYALGGWPWAAVLVLFALPASALTALGGRRKIAASAQPEHGRGRSSRQVLANGAVAAVAAGAHAWGAAWAPAAFLGALAAATADTWATELGMLSPHPPRLVTTGAPVEPGKSGGVTLLGLAAGAAGAALIARAAPALGQSGRMAAAVWVAGVAGMLLDSLLGATVQGVYRCASCGRAGEHRVCCGTPASRVAGLHSVDNDVVNLAATIFGAAAAALLR